VSLITINADFTEVVKVWREIRDILKRAFPEELPRMPTKPLGPEALSEFDPEAEWNRERLEEAKSAEKE
jgi:hypothetical protein